MKGTQRISALITNPDMILPGRINIIEANCSAGKTHFALNTIPQWARNPERILYLIDTNNGELRIQEHILTVSRQTYALADYCSGKVWGEGAHDADGKMPVMTYSGFGSEVRHGRNFNWQAFDFIVCDEMQNLVNYQKIPGNKINLEAAEGALRKILQESSTRIIALSATPFMIRKCFGNLCNDVCFDRNDLFCFETTLKIPYKQKIETILDEHKGETGILYTEQVADMKRYIDYANSIGLRANGFWSINADTQRKYPMDRTQFALRDTVLREETIPTDLDLLVINRASETCIKIDGHKRTVDYMIVHDKNHDIQTQVRGRYHGDLPVLYFHDIEAANHLACKSFPEQYLNVRLYAQERNEICRILDLRKSNDPNGSYYKWPTVRKYLTKNGYTISDSLKDSKRSGQHYYIVTL